MSRLPDEAPQGSELPRFDHLPVLTAYTARDDGGTHVIDDCNDRFRERLCRDRSAVVGSPLERFYDTAGVPDPPVADDGPRGACSDGGDSVPVDGSVWGPGAEGGPTTGGAATWRPTAAERDLVAADGRLVHTVAESVPREGCDGYAVFHVDVTGRERREKQVAALNRLLRHNVRNDLNLLRGYARTLCDHDDEAVVKAGDVIDRIADRWLELAATGREIDHLSANRSPGTVDLSSLVSGVRAAVEQDHPGGRVETEFDGVDREVEVSERWYAALVELCENGIKHAGSGVDGAATDAAVSVTVEPAESPGWISVAVADEGPGIPSEERATLAGDAETPLRHGSGLGMWLVRFVVEQFGGRVTVRDRDHGGSVVTLTVPVTREA